MSQRLTSYRFPYVPLVLRVGHDGHRLEAMLDTGFEGDVAVTADLISVGSQPDGHVPCQLADGSEIVAPFYRGLVELGGLGAFAILILALGDEPIVGRGVTDRFLVTLDHGREVRIES